MVYKWFSALVEELRSNEVSFLNVFGYHMVSPELDGKKISPGHQLNITDHEYLPQAALRCRRDRTWADAMAPCGLMWTHITAPKKFKLFKDHQRSLIIDRIFLSSIHHPYQSHSNIFQANSVEAASDHKPPIWIPPWRASLTRGHALGLRA